MESPNGSILQGVSVQGVQSGLAVEVGPPASFAPADVASVALIDDSVVEVSSSLVESSASLDEDDWLPASVTLLPSVDVSPSPAVVVELSVSTLVGSVPPADVVGDVFDVLELSPEVWESDDDVPAEFVAGLTDVPGPMLVAAVVESFDASVCGAELFSSLQPKDAAQTNVIQNNSVGTKRRTIRKPDYVLPIRSFTFPRSS